MLSNGFVQLSASLRETRMEAYLSSDKTVEPADTNLGVSDVFPVSPTPSPEKQTM